MEDKGKDIYEAPAMMVVEVKMKAQILIGSESEGVAEDFDWEII